MEYKLYPGKPYPLGSHWDGEGVNFALFSDNAQKIELCIFDNSNDEKEIARFTIKERTHNVWHVYIPELKPGILYGYRVYGPYDPLAGKRFNPNKLLIDPYAKAFSGISHWNDALLGYDTNSEDQDLSFDSVDSAAYVPKSVVIDSSFEWEGDKALKIPYHETIIYETHVKGFTMLHPDIPEEIRGTYTGLAHPASIEYLKKMGITAVELMPIHHFITDKRLHDLGLTNYWGYNSIGFFAPDARYARKACHGEQVIEFKNMVKELHKAGIEVILDVVYNHTGEGNHLGPTVVFRGIDNTGYYRLKDDKRFYKDYTGTGNTLNAMMPGVLRIIMDSLRYWIIDMHIDGFRFDLASALARELHDVDKLGSFFDIIHQDPVISQAKLIAEPWDVGEGGYQVGEFPPGWAEWNGKYRDCIRDYWRGAKSTLAEFSMRFTGSSDLYKDDYRSPMASINFVTAHDGFTLNDLVSYNEKHNQANGEDNKDGESHNRSWNCGEEGPSNNPMVLEWRRRQKRNFLATLFLSQGVPMLLSGDEFGRTQNGNNNAYCQDNELSWTDWQNIDSELLEFTQKLIQLRKKHPVFRRRKWFQGQSIKGNGLKDIGWFLPDGTEMQQEQWNQDFALSLAVYMNGQGIRSVGSKGEKILDDSFYILFNASHVPINFKLPSVEFGNSWKIILDTSEDHIFEQRASFHPGELVKVEGRSIVLLNHPLKETQDN